MADRNLRKTRVGIVVSDKMDKTIVVAVVDNVKLPLYKHLPCRRQGSRNGNQAFIQGKEMASRGNYGKGKINHKAL